MLRFDHTGPRDKTRRRVGALDGFSNFWTYQPAWVRGDLSHLLTHHFEESIQPGISRKQKPFSFISSIVHLLGWRSRPISVQSSEAGLSSGQVRSQTAFVPRLSFDRHHRLARAFVAPDACREPWSESGPKWDQSASEVGVISSEPIAREDVRSTRRRREALDSNSNVNPST